MRAIFSVLVPLSSAPVCTATVTAKIIDRKPVFAWRPTYSDPVHNLATRDASVRPRVRDRQHDRVRAGAGSS